MVKKVSPSKKNQPPKDIAKETFSCHFCGGVFQTYAMYDEHIKTHIIHQCKTCFKVFASEEGLKNHIKMHGEPVDGYDELFCLNYF
jgi:transcription elongation factor Elf1